MSVSGDPFLYRKHKVVDRIAQFEQLKMRLKRKLRLRPDFLSIFCSERIKVFPVESIYICPLKSGYIHGETGTLATELRMTLKKPWQLGT
jgi:hypothetical protein